MLKFLTTASIAVALAGCVSNKHVESANYTCAGSAFGCWHEYTGPRDRAAAERYLSQSKSVLEWVVVTYPDVESAHLNLERGELVLQVRRGGNHLDIGSRDIMTRFNSEEIFLVNTVIMDSQMATVRRVMANFKVENDRGRARFWALKDVGVVTGAGSASSETLKAFSPVRRDSFGNVVAKF